jgi:hypothetical protein
MRSSRTSVKPANAKTATKLLAAMTGKASPAKADQCPLQWFPRSTA